MKPERFWVDTSLPLSGHGLELAAQYDGGQLIPIVDERKGGYIAYAISEKRATIIAKALNYWVFTRKG